MTKLYPQIFTRKSVRKYRADKLSQDACEKVLDLLGATKPLDGAQPLRGELKQAGEVRGLFLVKAPQYLCLYGDKGANSLISAGYSAQQLVLTLNANGISSCYLGAAKPSRRGGDYLMALALGYAAEAPLRTSEQQFRRKPLSEVTDIEGIEDIARAVRLAPSAVNSQPWFLTGDRSEIAVCRKTGLGQVFLQRLNEFDMGIALCHLEIAALHAGLAVKLRVGGTGRAPRGYVCTASASIK